LFNTTASCERHGIDPFRYLAAVLQRLPTTPSYLIIEFPPDVWFETDPLAARERAT
jgi:hypothetical protein